MTVVSFRDKSGTAEFTCTCCSRHVVVIVPPDDEPICLTCRFLEREIPESERAALREFLAAQEIA